MNSFETFAREVLKRVGIVKNELLAFAVIVTLILNVFGISLDVHDDHAQKIGGLIMHLSTIPILLFFGFVYVYALLKLPSSQQELIFTEEAKKMLTEHRRARKKEMA